MKPAFLSGKESSYERYKEIEKYEHFLSQNDRISQVCKNGTWTIIWIYVFQSIFHKRFLKRF